MKDSNSVTVSGNGLRKFCYEVLQACNADEFSASATADGLVLASLRGVDSHGVQLLPHYVKAIKAGRLNTSPKFHFNQTASSVGLLNADHALGFPAGHTAMAHCIDMAKATGMGAVSVFNSTHNGMLANYTIPAAEKGFFALVVTNTTPRLIPTGARKAFLGTNPICYAFPLQDEEPLCYDAATTLITGNKIQLYRKTGATLPDGVAADKEGNITTDANLAELLVPFGGYKGFGLALLVDVLCGVLSGMPNSDGVTSMYGKDLSAKRYLGQFYLVFDISKFRSVELFTRELQTEINKLRNLPCLEEPVLACGDKEKAICKERTEKGIPLEIEIFNLLKTTGEELNVQELTLN